MNNSKDIIIKVRVPAAGGHAERCEELAHYLLAGNAGRLKVHTFEDCELLSMETVSSYEVHDEPLVAKV